MLNKMLMAAVSLIAITSVAGAQEDKAPRGNAGAPPAAAQPDANMGNSMGNSAKEMAPGTRKESGESARDLAPGQSKPAGQSARDEAPGQKNDDKAERKSDAGDKSPAGAGRQADEKRETRDKQSDADRVRDSSDRKADRAGRDGDGDKADRGASGASEGAAGKDARGKSGKGSIAEVTTEQKTRVKSAFTKHRVAPARDIDISVSVGVAVPRTVKFYPVPEDIVVIAPAYRSYLYFIIDDKVCIVDPDSYEIVDIIVIA